jgi:hypothetical protein
LTRLRWVSANSESLERAESSGIWDRLEVGDSVDKKLVREAISRDNTWAIADTHPGILAARTRLSSSKRLGTYFKCGNGWNWILRSSPPRTKNASYKKSGGPCCFLGFDGNNEHEHVSVAEFYIDQMERFVHFESRKLNAHMMTLGRHRQMLRNGAPSSPKDRWGT